MTHNTSERENSNYKGKKKYFKIKKTIAIHGLVVVVDKEYNVNDLAVYCHVCTSGALGAAIVTQFTCSKVGLFYRIGICRNA